MNILLWDMIGVGVILDLNTGVVFENQVGGTKCVNRSQEGVFAPINFDVAPEDYESSLEYKLGCLFLEQPFNEDIAEKIDDLLSANTITEAITVNRSKLKQSEESWVYVNVAANENCSIKTNEVLEGVLTWPNSD